MSLEKKPYKDYTLDEEKDKGRDDTPRPPTAARPDLPVPVQAGDPVGREGKDSNPQTPATEGEDNNPRARLINRAFSFVGAIRY